MKPTTTRQTHPTPTTCRRLETICNSEPGTLRAAVAKTALEYGSDDPVDFFRDLLQHGCISGVVGSLVYYTDTHAFFDRHYEEIEDLRGELEKSLGEPLRIQGDLKNWLAWFGFEETAHRLAINDLELEI